MSIVELKNLMGGGHAMVVARMKFAKGGQVRYISHLDLQRTFQRALRRGEIDITYSQGFNPHPKISFAMALAVGMTSEGEYADVELNKLMDPHKLMTKLNTTLPKGLKILDCRISDKKHPSLMSVIQKGIYRIEIYTNHKYEEKDIQKRIEEFLQQKEIKVEKINKKGKIKERDIRPLIDKIQLEKIEGQCISLTMQLAAGSQANLKAEVLVEKFLNHDGNLLSYDFIKIHRIQLLAIGKEGFVSPIELF